MDNQQLNNAIPQYSVRIWEVILIVMGAIALVGVGIIGLLTKASTNALDPARAEAIAKSLIDYNIPGGSQGVFGINIGSAKLAWVRSTSEPPDVILFVGKTPITKETDKDQLNKGFENTPSNNIDQEFTVTASRVENKQFCGKTIPVTVEEGTQAFSNQPSSVPAIRYTASTTEENIERRVILIANGNNAPQKANTVFRSLRCK
ncbi:MAG TPA: hypothetical protein V6D14_22570 [Coleofasciculaceae cyanobacterium]|jgi:hypothetical protein